MKKNIIYSVFTILLFLSPLLFPANGKDYTLIPVCIFVVLCYTFNIRSVVKIITPVFIFSAILPVLIQLAMFKSIPLPWEETISNFVSGQTVETLLSYFIPSVLALMFCLIINKFSNVSKNT